METKLVDGLAYCELKFATTQRKDGSTYISKSGDKMLSVSWSVVDVHGNVGFIYDFLMKAIPWKITNLENATGVRGLYNEKTGEFNEHVLRNVCCAAAIGVDEKSPDYGPKINKYIPLQFFNVVTETTTKGAVKHANATSQAVVQTETTVVNDADDFDDLPF